MPVSLSNARPVAAYVFSKLPTNGPITVATPVFGSIEQRSPAVWRPVVPRRTVCAGTVTRVDSKQSTRKRIVLRFIGTVKTWKIYKTPIQKVKKDLSLGSENVRSS